MTTEAIKHRVEPAVLQTGTTRDKILELEDLAGVVASLKSSGRKVVLCHGVFDLLHIGHIRHFEQARHNGDVLVVTITPDHLVNKGPHRPAFSQALRAEALAALNCVDYVAVNRWSMAIELIELIRPDFYVKGADYQDADKDVTGGITLERQAVESVGGQLLFTDDIVFSSSALINRHMPVLSRELSDYLDAFSGDYSADDVVRYLELMRPLRVLTIGEAIIDEYRYCKAIGKSSKEPMLAVKQLSTERFAGGTLAVANNVANFSDNAGIITFLGDRDSEESFVRSNLNESINAQLLRRRNSPTIVKTRFIEDYFFSKLFEVYSINDAALDREDERALCATLAEVVPTYDAVIVVDFGHGMLTADAARVICEKARFLALNTQSNAGNLGYQSIYKYPRADYVCITQDEARLEARDRTGDLRTIVPILAERIHCDRFVVTRGSSGSLAYSSQSGFYEAPALAGQVVDRMGAGDSFLSVTAMAAALSAPLEVISFIGNAVGAQAVATVGHRQSISRSALTKFVTALLK